ncbi:MAG: dihydroxyacetone kinase subunit DhaL [Anaerolineae bacterium]
MTEIGVHELAGMIAAISAAIAESRDELNRLDSALGDGDHGTSLSVAFADAAAKVAALEQPTPTSILSATAHSLMNRMGGASGALYGTLFLRAGMAAKDKAALSHDDMKTLWRAALDGVIARGKAKPGDKTMIDALQPAVDAFAAAATLDESFERAAAAAAEGAQATANMVAQHGRARFVGERALGHVDAGARSIAVMFAAMNAYWKENLHGEA